MVTIMRWSYWGSLYKHDDWLFSNYCNGPSLGGHDEQESKAKVAIIHSIKDQLKQENEATKTLRKDLKEIQDKIKAEKEVSCS